MPVRVGEIAEKTRLIGEDTTLASVLTLFLSEPDCEWLTVVKDRRPAGLLRRQNIMELAATSGQETLHALTAGEMVDLKPLRIDGNLPAAKLAMDHEATSYRQLLNGAMVTQDRRYVGVLSLSSLLKAVSRENAARAMAMRKSAEAPPVEEAPASSPAVTTAKPPSNPPASSTGTQYLMATLAHEVRTPLTGMMGLAEMLATRLQDTESKDLAQTIVQSGETLDRILKDTLDYVSLESGAQKILPEPADLNQLVGELRRLWSAQASRRGLSLYIGLSPDGPHRIDVDIGKVRQVANNLISNALKFTSRGGVSVTVGTQEQASALMLSIEVSDTGRGIGPADKSRFFQAFEKGEVVSDAPGWGLGLTISHALARHLGGQLTLTDNPGGGSVFTLSAPVNSSAIVTMDTRKTIKSGQFSLGDVLVIEDHEACAMVMIQALETAGWTVHHAASLNLAEDILARREFQAILTDLHLGDGSALSLIENIRRHEDADKATPILVTTADITDGARQACLAIGADRALSKPIQGPALVATLADVLMSRAASTPSLPQLRRRLAS